MPEPAATLCTGTVTVSWADLDLVMNHAGNPQRIAEYPAACQRIRDALAREQP
ncbi:hypothetical protein ACIBG4_40580 [Nonomuraea sp. NPDC050383]|uniref:hypothetical protein n=1 Tax=Nonomuraea sp. NPDC050383 TaxID=3364362 RepID=UPI0037A2A907